MIKTPFILILAIVTAFLLIRVSPAKQSTSRQASFYPVAVKTVIDNKCYGCHSVKGKSQDAKDALMWDSLPGLSKGKIVATLNDMIEVLDKNEMPPPEVIKKYPEMKLEAIDKKTIRTWAENKADSLLK